MMHKIKKILILFILICGIGIGSKAYTQPNIPKEKIPTNIPPDVRKQIERLYSTNPSERVVAAFRLSEMGERAIPAIPFLIAILSDDIGVNFGHFGLTSTGREALETLIKMGKPAAVDPLIAALKDESQRIRERAAEALGLLEDPRAVEPLIAVLKDEDPSVRWSAVDALSMFKDPRAVEPLIAVLKDEDPKHSRAPLKEAGLLLGFINVRERAAEALGLLEDPRAVEPLIAVLKDESRNLRRSAIISLGQIKDYRAVRPLIAALWDVDEDTQEWAASALVKITGNNFGKDPVKWEKWWEQTGKLSIMTENLPSVEDSQIYDVRKFIQQLKDKDRRMRFKAVSALGKTRDRRIVEPLISSLLKDEFMEIRLMAAVVLGEIKDKRAVEPLIMALKDKETSVRAVVANALGRLKDKRAVEPLIMALKDKETMVRCYVADALGGLKDYQAVEPLIAIFTDEDVGIGSEKDHKNLLWMTVGALSTITGKNFGLDYVKWQKWWEQNKEKYLKKK